MGKDPAFLFYPGDWLGGTISFSRKHKGAYMDLLMAQFNMGHMGIDDIRDILGSDFDLMWESKLKSKFVKDDKGLFYNKRLEEEKLKRSSYVKSRKKNFSSDKAAHKDTHMASHMENENKDENEYDKEIVEEAEKWVEHIKKNMVSAKPNVNKYCGDIDKLIRIDKLDIVEIKKIRLYLELNICNGNFSWTKVIGSPGKLRNKTRSGDMRIWESIQNSIKQSGVRFIEIYSEDKDNPSKPWENGKRGELIAVR